MAFERLKGVEIPLNLRSMDLTSKMQTFSNFSLSGVAAGLGVTVSLVSRMTLSMFVM